MENIEQPTEELKGAQFDSDEGSILGKFKDATSLLHAYTNLQAEFTRKSQRLKELEKMVATDALSPKESALQQQSAPEADATASENKDCDTLTAQQDLDSKLSACLLQFVKDNPDATNYVEDIKQEIINQTSLLSLSGGVDIAFRLAKEKRKSLPADLVNNAQFIQEYILSNSNITNMVVDEYIKSLAQGKTTPKIMSGQSKSMVFSPNENQPQTLADANKIFSKMLEK